MPYISIKSWPKDEATRRAAVEKIFEVFPEVWGCAPEHLTISAQEIAPEAWEEQVVKGEIEPNMDNVMILSGQKTERMLK